MKILVAEDAEFNHMIIEQVVCGLGHEVVIVMNGKEALGELISNNFDLVLMDIEMPVMDGISATKAIRESGNMIKIIALTSHNNESYISSLLTQGFDAYLSKPFTEDEMRLTLDAIYIPFKENVTHQENNDSLVNFEYLQTISGGDVEYENQMVDLFLQLAPEALNNMKSHLDANDFMAISLEAHKFASQVEFFGIKNVGHYLDKIEDFGKKRINTNEIPDLLTTVTEICNLAIKELEKHH